jgi:hypothetical protein
MSNGGNFRRESNIIDGFEEFSFLGWKLQRVF